MNCDNCGVCCFEQGSPPGYLLLLDGRDHPDWPDQEDIERVKHLPPQARAHILRYKHKLRHGKVSGDGPCCWLNQQTNRCRFYDHRPQICRNLDVGSEGCRSWRDEYNVDEREGVPA
jgi:Fe-S-cluster containining protein